jgi:hypothetical protein
MMHQQLSAQRCYRHWRRAPSQVAAPSLRRRTRASAAAATTTLSAAAPFSTERLELRDPHTGATLHIFGVDHRYSQPDVAAWILRARPAAVVVETACTPAHGLAAATPLDAASPEQLNAPGASSFFLRMFAQVASALRSELLETGTKNVTERGMGADEAYGRAVDKALGAGDGGESGGENGGESGSNGNGVWSQASKNFNGEQLAYVAGLAVGAPVIFGDRPKETTYKRLWHGLSSEDLDAAFEDERVRETVEELRGLAEEWGAAGAAFPASAAEALAAGERLLSGGGGSSTLTANKVDRIMLLERDAVMCAVLSLACKQARERRQMAAAQAAEAAAGSDDQAAAALLLEERRVQDESTPLIITGVFGAAHLPGIQRLWESGEWRAMLAAADGGSTPSSSSDTDAADPATLLASSPLLQAPLVDASAMLSPQAGAKRGLLEALLSNSVTEEVLEDLDRSLPAVPALEPKGGFASVEELFEASYQAPHPATAARFWSREIYGTFRMRLAALPVDVLDGVASWWPGAAEEGAPLGSDLPPEARSAWGLLAPLRALRPSFGGPGWDPAVGVQLRQLNYEFGGAEEESEGGGQAAAASEDSDQTAAAAAFFQDV